MATTEATATCVHYWLLASPAHGSSHVRAGCRLCGIEREYETSWKGADWNGETQPRGLEEQALAG